MTKRNQPGGGIGSKAVAKVTTYMTGHDKLTIAAIR